MIINHFGELVAARGVTLTELARVTGAGRGNLSKLRQGTTLYNAGTLDKLCHYFGVGVGDILEYVPPERQDEALRELARAVIAAELGSLHDDAL